MNSLAVWPGGGIKSSILILFKNNTLNNLKKLKI